MTTTEAPNQGSRFVPHIDNANPAPERPTDELDRIPRSVPASKITAFLADLGLTLNDIPWGETSALRIGGTCITVTIIALNADGHAYVDRATGEIAVHHVTIPVVDDQTPRR